MSNIPSSILPKDKPKLTQEALRALITGIDRTKYPIVVVGVRDYYLSMSKPGTLEDRDIYNSAIFLDTPTMTLNFNGNTNPTLYKAGSGFDSNKGMAVLNTGTWYAHQFGIHHNEYPALIQTGGQVQVTRDGTPAYQDKGYFGINIHKGGWGITSSEGCQTIYPGEWPDFINNITAEAIRIFGGAKYKSVIIPYLLIENTGQISK